MSIITKVGPGGTFDYIKTDSGHEVPAIQTPDGTWRRLDLLAKPGNHLGLPTVKEMVDAGTLQPIPRTQWTAVDTRHFYGPVRNQSQFSSCTGNGSVGLLTKVRSLMGMKPVLLSASFPYAQNNGGVDAGAVGADVMQTLVDLGTPTDAECPEASIYKRQIPQSAYTTAKRFRAGILVYPEDFDDFVTVILNGGGVAFGLQVGGDFNNLDDEGCCPADRGPGNHWVFADGVRKLQSGEYALDGQNSWDVTWGDHGRMGVRERVFQRGDQPCAVGMLTAEQDPQEADQPPDVPSGQ